MGRAGVGESEQTAILLQEIQGDEEFDGVLGRPPQGDDQGIAHHPKLGSKTGHDQRPQQGVPDERRPMAGVVLTSEEDRVADGGDTGDEPVLTGEEMLSGVKVQSIVETDAIEHGDQIAAHRSRERGHLVRAAQGGVVRQPGPQAPPGFGDGLGRLVVARGYPHEHHLRCPIDPVDWRIADANLAAVHQLQPWTQGGRGPGTHQHVAVRRETPAPLHRRVIQQAVCLRPGHRADVIGRAGHDRRP